MSAVTDLEIEGLSHGQELGSGGFATVFAATEERFDRTVAVKIITNLDEAGRRRFEREQLTMGRMAGHPNVVVPHSSGYTSSGLPYLVMEYLAGGSLADVLDANGPLSWERASDYLMPIADALGHGHQLGILHRDVKPENILVDTNGTPKLADFGIASIRESTATVGRAFSLAHAPPETFSGGTDLRDERSDLYSLASTLYTLVCGRPPFHSTSSTDSDLAYLARIAERDAPPVGEDPYRNAFVARAMAKRLADRFQTAAEFNEALARSRGYDYGGQGRTAVGVGPAALAPIIRPPARAPIDAEPTTATGLEGDPPSVPMPRRSLPFRGRLFASLVGASLGIGVLVLAGLYFSQRNAAETVTDPATAQVASTTVPTEPGGGESQTSTTENAIDQAQAAIDLGRLAFESGDFEVAIEHFDEAIELDPNSSDAYANRGLAYKELREFGRSLEDNERAVELDPDNALGWHGRGAVSSEFGDYLKAISDLDRAIELDPNYADSYVSRGFAYEHLAMTELALDDYNQALDIDPRNVGALNNRASVFAAQGESDRAMADYDVALGVEPDNPILLLNRGNEHAVRGDYQDAIVDLDRAIEIDPKNAVAFTNRGVAYDGLGNTERANEDYREAVRLTESGEASYPMDDLSALEARLAETGD